VLILFLFTPPSPKRRRAPAAALSWRCLCAAAAAGVFSCRSRCMDAAASCRAFDCFRRCRRRQHVDTPASLPGQPGIRRRCLGRRCRFVAGELPTSLRERQPPASRHHAGPMPGPASAPACRAAIAPMPPMIAYFFMQLRRLRLAEFSSRRMSSGRLLTPSGMKFSAFSSRQQFSCASAARRIVDFPGCRMGSLMPPPLPPDDCRYRRRRVLISPPAAE